MARLVFRPQLPQAHPSSGFAALSCSVLRCRLPAQNLSAARHVFAAEFVERPFRHAEQPHRHSATSALGFSRARCHSADGTDFLRLDLSARDNH